MRNIAFAAVAAIVLAASGFALRADEAIGAVVSIDAVGRTVTLDNGQTFVLAPTIDPGSLEIGQHVTVTYEPTADGLNAATKISPIAELQP
jgi:hypothetical protein